jgi:hypothetical protein
MLRCKQVTTMVAGDELADAGSWLRLKVRLHLMMCRHCSRYVAQLRTIGDKARENFGAPSDRNDHQDLQQRILDSARKSKADRDLH